MISFSLGYILLCFVALVGVVFVIYGLSQYKEPPRSAGRGAQDHSRYLLETTPTSGKEVRGVSRQYQPEVPKKFDPDFIQMQLVQIQQSPNLVASYMNSLAARFRSRVERDFLESLEKYNLRVAKGVASEAEIFKAKKELEDSKYEYALAADREMHGLRREDVKLTYQESIARKQANIQNLQPKPSEEPMRKNTPSPEEVREKMEGRWKVKADDDDARDRFIRKRLAEMDEDERQEFEELERETELSEEYKQRKRYEIQSRYAKKKERLFNNIPF